MATRERLQATIERGAHPDSSSEAPSAAVTRTQLTHMPTAHYTTHYQVHTCKVQLSARLPALLLLLVRWPHRHCWLALLLGGVVGLSIWGLIRAATALLSLHPA